MRFNCIFLCLLVWCCFSCCSGKRADHAAGIDSLQYYVNPISATSLGHHVLFHRGMYYGIFGGLSNIYLRAAEDVTLLKDKELKNIWNSTDSSVRNIDDAELHYIDSKWYVYFTGNDNNLDDRCIYVLENDSPDPMQGTFKLKGRIETDREKSVAMFSTVFQQDGRLYLVWCGWPSRRVYEENQCIYIAEMKNPWTLSSERVLISKPEYEWECQWVGIDGNRTAYPIYVNECPQVFRSLRQDKILIYYAASGRWTPYYCEGMLQADASADLLNSASWKKCPVPVFDQNTSDKLYGPSIVCFIPSPDETEYYYLYNVRKDLEDMFISLDKYEVCMQKVEWDKDGIPVLGCPLRQDTLLRKPSGTRRTTD
ncbi:glycoside hydrolase family 43 protein [uncultured Bacteroides sp.]|uniref:glycoside hydrolase family 43 protein n=1 Tax=uncultured Bacteroides sp. TaxID=162156 RepID=UPI00262F2F60|nr:glycoside hydrolase family 43 protein [uncultured Bacteroides sp.]